MLALAGGVLRAGWAVCVGGSAVCVGGVLRRVLSLDLNLELNFHFSGLSFWLHAYERQSFWLES